MYGTWDLWLSQFALSEHAAMTWAEWNLLSLRWMKAVWNIKSVCSLKCMSKNSTCLRRQGQRVSGRKQERTVLTPLQVAKELGLPRVYPASGMSALQSTHGKRCCHLILQPSGVFLTIITANSDTVWAFWTPKMSDFFLFFFFLFFLSFFLFFCWTRKQHSSTTNR